MGVSLVIERRIACYPWKKTEQRLRILATLTPNDSPDVYSSSFVGLDVYPPLAALKATRAQVRRRYPAEPENDKEAARLDT
jgi:hypothetical protein